MDSRYSSYLKENHQLLKDIVNKLKEKYEFVSILGSDVIGNSIRVTNRQVSVSDSSCNEKGFVVRVYNNNMYSEYSFNELTSVEDIVSKVEESVDIKEQLASSIYAKAFENKLYKEDKIVKDFSRMDMFEDISFDDVVTRSKKIVKESMDENEYIISASVSSEKVIISKVYISNNKELTQVYAWASVSYSCVVNRDENTNFNYGAESSISFVDAFDKLENQVKEISEEATLLLSSEHVVPGEYECITTPEITGLIAHEAFGHGVEMDMFVKNRALGASYVGKRVGSDLVEMHEGAIPYLDVSSYFFDDEGTLAHDTVEIKDGILKTGVADAIAASHLGIEPTGNGKRESYKRKAYSRMTTTYFSPKDSTLEEMIQSIKFGYLIDRENSGMEDPKNWGIQCIAMIGKEIKDGKLTGKVVSPIIMTGYVPDLLNSVSMVSNDFKTFGSGFCGKGYKEWVKTSLGGPYLKVKVKLG